MSNPFSNNPFGSSGSGGGGGGGSGDVVGPASATDNALTRFNTTTGKLIQNSTVALSDTGDLSGVNSIDFTPISAPAHNEGLLFYDDDRKALSYYNNEAEVSMQIGFEMWVQVRNSTGSTIANGQVVYLSGATGQRPNAILAQANTMATSRVIGMATHDIENNSDGIVTVFGTVRDLDTSAFTDGQIVYLSATTPGAVTATAPTAPNLTVQIGVVQHAHITQGTILIHPETDSVDADSIFNSTAAARAFIKNIDSTAGITVQTGATTFAKRTLTGTANEITVTNGDGVSGAPTFSLPTDINLSGKSSLAIPVSATPTVNANGEIALDTTVTDFSHGVLKYYGGEELAVVAMPLAQLTSPVNGAVPTYNSTTDEFEMAVPSGGGGGAKNWEFISTTTASNQTLLEIDLTGSYRNYMVEFVDVVPVSNGYILQMRTSSDGGTTFDSGTDNYSWAYSGYGFYFPNRSMDTKISLTYLTKNVAGSGANGFLTVLAPAAARHVVFMSNMTETVFNSDLMGGLIGTSKRLTTSGVNALQFFFSTGNISSGSFRLYGTND